MAISRITTWAEGQVLTAADLNAEFNNILNNATTLISPLTGNLDFNLNQATNLRLENLSASPAVVSTGRLFSRNTTSLQMAVSGADSTGYASVSAGMPTRVQGLTGSIISNIASFAALSYQLGTQALGSFSITATSSFSINTQTPGPAAGGRDQAAAFASTDVHFYAIGYTPGSTVIRGICSSNPPPTGPSGVSYWTYLCSAKYNVGTSIVSGGNLIVAGSFIKKASFTSLGPFQTTGLLSTSVDVSGVVPQIVSGIQIAVSGAGGESSNSDLSMSYAFRGQSTMAGINGSVVFESTARLLVSGGTEIIPTIPGATSQIYVEVTNNNGGYGQVSGSLRGYIVPNGDN